jgi:hypothetical protein
MGGHEHAPVVELHEAVLADDLDGLAREPRAGLVAGGREADHPVPAHPPCRQCLDGRFRFDRDVVSGRIDGRFAGEAEPVPGDRAAEGLVGSLVVVEGDPPVELRLRVVDRGEGLAVEELPSKGLVPPLDLPRRGR